MQFCNGLKQADNKKIAFENVEYLLRANRSTYVTTGCFPHKRAGLQRSI